MRKNEFWLVYAILLVGQFLLSNYFIFTPYLMLSILPVMVLCLPIRVDTLPAMFIAAATGLSVDFLTEGLLGLNALALIPVAFVRKSIIGMIFGEDLFARKEDFSAQRHGFGKVAMAIFIVQALFVGIYVWADAAGTRPLWFNLARFFASLAVGFLMSLLASEVLAPDTRR